MQTQQLGNTRQIHIHSNEGPFHVLPDYTVTYPAVVIAALAALYEDYNEAFGPLVSANAEWKDDYQFAFHGEVPCNFAVQIDMVGLDDATLKYLEEQSFEQVRYYLLGQIFEIENSMAMYQLLERICASEEGGPSFFGPRWRRVLADVTRRTGLPNALLAVTEEKASAMRLSEFGKSEGEPLSDDEVRALTGFDRFFGPTEFREYLAANDGTCEFALYVRSSDPLDRLRNPNAVVEHPLLGDTEIRRVIKAHAVTFNIDAPEMGPDRQINDTKGYMAPMGMGFEIRAVGDLIHPTVLGQMGGKKGFLDCEGPRLNPEFASFIESSGISTDDVELGTVQLRAKPLKGTYGCYGHQRGPLSSGKKFRTKLASELRTRGAYIVQPEMPVPRIKNDTCGTVYAYIDRNFFGMVDGRAVFMGGFRTLLPEDSREVKKGRLHGNGDTVWAAIVAEE